MEINEVKEISISDFFVMCQEEEGEYQINTPDGWQDINFLVKKKNRKCYNLITENGLELGCSENHNVLTDQGWKKSKDLNVNNDYIHTKHGKESLIAKEYIGEKNTFDLNINSKEHKYYSNDIISHNCGKSLICKVISNLWDMPLLRLDFGKLFGSLVGDSERHARETIKIAEAVAPCVSGDTKIRLEYGEVEIESIFNDIGYKVNLNNEQFIIAFPEESIKILSYDIENDNYIINKMKAIIRKKIIDKKIYHITLSDNKKIKVSENHKFFSVKFDKTWKQVKNLREGDEIYSIYFSRDGNIFGRENKEIVKIEEINNIEYVYDPCCEAPYTYISNDIISHNCILWIDEIEKALSGAKSSESTDGGTTSRVLGTFLTWMQEKEANVFVVATANDHQSIPPEFQRAGRFDEVFFVDLPSEEERVEIFKVILRRKGIDFGSNDFNFNLLGGNSEHYSGAEIEKAIDEAMLVGFEEGRRLIQGIDISIALTEFKPLYEMRKEDFESMREWAKGRCVLANDKGIRDKSTINIERKGRNLKIEESK